MAVELGDSPYRAAQIESIFTKYAWSYWLGLAGYIVAIVLFMVLIFAAVLKADGRPRVDHDLPPGMVGSLIVSGVAMAIAGGVCIAAWVFGMMQLYRSWAVMQGPGARTTPGKAVGYLFIPFYNFYWIFVAYHGLVRDINAWLDANPESDAAHARPSLGLAQAMCITWVCTAIPYLGSLAAMGWLVLLFLVHLQLKNAIVAIITSRAAAAAPATAQ